VYRENPSASASRTLWQNIASVGNYVYLGMCPRSLAMVVIMRPVIGTLYDRLDRTGVCKQSYICLGGTRL